VGLGVRFAHLDPAIPATLGKLEAQAALADPRLGDHAHDLRVSLHRPIEGGFEYVHLFLSADEGRESAGVGTVEPGTQGPDALQVVNLDGIAQPFDLEESEVSQMEEARDHLRGRFTQVDGAGIGELFHARGEPDGVSLSRVIHAQVVADTTHHDFTRVDSHAHGERNAEAALQFCRVAPQFVVEIEGRVACALRVVFMGDGRAEQGHDPVAGELIDRSLEAMDPLAQYGEEAIHDVVKEFGVDLIRQLHRSLDVDEEHRHVLALSFERGASGEDALRQMARGVVAGYAGVSAGRMGKQGFAAALAVCGVEAVGEIPAARMRVVGGGNRGQPRRADPVVGLRHRFDLVLANVTEGHASSCLS